MHRIETLPLSGINTTSYDVPKVFNVTHKGRTFTYDAIVGNTPAVTSEYDGFARPQMVLEAEQPTAWDESRYYPVGRLATFHGRNLEILADAVEIEDEMGNQFYSLGIKGSDMSNLHLMKSVTAERDYIINGLQESLVMERVLRASRLLRENEVDTEYICGLVIPDTFLAKQAEALLAETEILSLPELLERLASQEAANNPADGKSPLETKLDLIDTFKDCDYLISYRAMNCPYRFGELRKPEQFNEFLAFARNIHPPEVTEKLFGPDATAEDYILDYYTPVIAQNLARMHSLGLRHGFLHSNNVTALGAVVDLDSCRGEALELGDEPSKEEDYSDDLSKVLAGIHGALHSVLDERQKDGTPDQSLNHFLSLSASIFLLYYFEERFGGDIDRQIEFLANVDISQHTERSTDKLIADIAIVDLYRILKKKQEDRKSYEDEVLTSLKEIEVLLAETEIDHHFLHGLPGLYFTTVRPHVLDGEKIVDPNRPNSEPVEHLIMHLIPSLSKYACFKALKNSGKTLNPDLALSVSTAFCNGPTGQQPETSKAIQSIVNVYLSKLESRDITTEHPNAAHLLGDVVPDIDTKYGTVGLTPVAYVTDDERTALFKKLFSYKNIRIKTVANKLLSSLDKEDIVAIADVRSASSLAGCDHSSTLNDWIKGVFDPNIQPLFLVSDISTDSPQILVYNTHPKNHQLWTTEELLDLFKPKVERQLSMTA